MHSKGIPTASGKTVLKQIEMVDERFKGMSELDIAIQIAREEGHYARLIRFKIKGEK